MNINLFEFDTCSMVRQVEQELNMVFSKKYLKMYVVWL